jgi:hypothetical protein
MGSKGVYYLASATFDFDNPHLAPINAITGASLAVDATDSSSAFNLISNVTHNTGILRDQDCSLNFCREPAGLI